MWQSESSSMSKNKEKTKVVRVKTAILAIFLSMALASLAASLLIVFEPDASIGIMIRRILPIPVAIADGAFISYGELDQDRDSVRRFYESQSDDLAERGFRVDFTTPDGKKRLLIREKDILNKLIEDRIILFLAKGKGIRFSDSDVNAKVEEAIRENGGDEDHLKDQLSRLYGWSLSEFKEKIVVPSLYRDALEAVFMKERDTSAAKSKIEEAASELGKGTDFETVAKTLSDGDSGKDGGSLGWTDVESLVPELQDAAKTQPVNVTGPIIESSLGFHIVVISDRKTESGKELVLMRQIFSRKPTFPDWLAEKKREAVVFVLPRRYIWDSESGSVLFRDESLRDFEKNAIQQSEGDPSLIF